MKHIKLNAKWRTALVPVFVLAAIGLFGFSEPSEAGKDTKLQHSPWVDLVTPDLSKAEAFYTELFGWSYDESEIKGIKTALIKKDGQVIGSMIEVKKAKSSVWMPAAPVSADQLKEKSKTLLDKGAKLAIGTMSQNSRGSQVVFEGAQGEEFSLIADNSYYDKSARSNNAGTFMGSELWASKPQDARNFYQYAFGVEVSQQDYEGKPYWFFELAGERIAGMIQNPITNQGSQWVSYIYADNPAAVAQQVTAKGGYVIAAPQAELRDGNVAVVQDPQGAIFCVHAVN